MTGLLINDEIKMICDEGLTVFMRGIEESLRNLRQPIYEVRFKPLTSREQTERPAATPNRSVLPGMPQTASFSTNNSQCFIKR
jgi:hypothetical protein